MCGRIYVLVATNYGIAADVTCVARHVALCRWIGGICDVLLNTGCTIQRCFHGRDAIDFVLFHCAFVVCFPITFVVVGAGHKRNALGFSRSHGHAHKRQSHLSPVRVNKGVKVFGKVATHERKRQHIKCLHHRQKASVRRHGKPRSVHGVDHVYKYRPGRQVAHGAHTIALLPKRGFF